MTFGQIAQAVLALGFVLALVGLLGMGVRKAQRRNSSPMPVLARCSLGKDASLVAVGVGDEVLLLGVSPGGVRAVGRTTREQFGPAAMAHVSGGLLGGDAELELAAAGVGTASATGMAARLSQLAGKGLIGSLLANQSKARRAGVARREAQAAALAGRMPWRRAAERGTERVDVMAAAMDINAAAADAAIIADYRMAAAAVASYQTDDQPRHSDYPTDQYQERDSWTPTQPRNGSSLPPTRTDARPDGTRSAAGIDPPRRRIA